MAATLHAVPASHPCACVERALQLKGIDSKFLYFPNENHWVLKPQNSVLWHDTVNAWLKAHLEGPKPIAPAKR